MHGWIRFCNFFLRGWVVGWGQLKNHLVGISISYWWCQSIVHCCTNDRFKNWVCIRDVTTKKRTWYPWIRMKYRAWWLCIRMKYRAWWPCIRMKYRAMYPSGRRKYRAWWPCIRIKYRARYPSVGIKDHAKCPHSVRMKHHARCPEVAWWSKKWNTTPGAM